MSITSVVVLIPLRHGGYETKRPGRVHFGADFFVEEFRVQAYCIAQCGSNYTAVDFIDHGWFDERVDAEEGEHFVTEVCGGG